MAESKERKKEFLVANDYGMGAVWMIFYARSIEEIQDRYPGLIAVEDRPKWITDELYKNIKNQEVYDIDDKPTGYLKAIIEKGEIGYSQ